jgi:hypothetical protein
MRRCSSAAAAEGAAAAAAAAAAAGSFSVPAVPAGLMAAQPGAALLLWGSATAVC